MTNRITKEIQHGRFLAKQGAGEIWNWESPAGRQRWKRRVQMLSGHLRPGMTILEIGCGTGYFTRELIRRGADIVAIDVSPDLLEIAKPKYSARNLSGTETRRHYLLYRAKHAESPDRNAEEHPLDQTQARRLT